VPEHAGFQRDIIANPEDAPRLIPAESQRQEESQPGGGGVGDSATSTPPTGSRLAEWWMRHKSFIYKALVSCSFRLRHLATGSYSRHETLRKAHQGATN